MKGTLLGHSAFHYLVSIDDYYIAVWAAVSREEVPRIVQEMLRGVTVCFALKTQTNRQLLTSWCLRIIA